MLTATSSSSAILSAAFSGLKKASFGSRPPSAASLALGGSRAAESGRVTAVAAEGKARGPTGIMKPRRVSPEMASFVGAAEIARTQALKIIWAYIKEHKLQDPENKRVIVCDEKLKSIFAGQERVGFLEVAKLISPHFLK